MTRTLLSAELQSTGLWMLRYMMAHGRTDAVIGLSGGADSTLVAKLAVDAGIRVHFRFLPCHSSPESLEYGLEVAEWLGGGASSEVIDLTATFDAMPGSMSAALIALLPEDERKAVALRMGNRKARLRMMALYDEAEKIGSCIVLGTTNRSEQEIGYFTKWGDGGVDIEPIVEYWKREVYAALALYGAPRSVQERAASADLWPGQTDEGELGCTYAQLESVFSWDGDEDVPSEIRQDLRRRAKVTAHKRRTPPGCSRSL